MVASHQLTKGRMTPVSSPGMVRDVGYLTRSADATADAAERAIDKAGSRRGTGRDKKKLG
jgi:hypothetical protein